MLVYMQLLLSFLLKRSILTRRFMTVIRILDLLSVGMRDWNVHV